MIEWWRKRRALKRIARRLPREMAERHGVTDAYTASQVEDVLERRGYDQRYWGYAFAMFLVADHAAREVGGPQEVQALRGEIADGYFHGDPGFTLDAAREVATGAGFHGPGGALGGGGFGDGGGGGFGGDGGGV